MLQVTRQCGDVKIVDPCRARSTAAPRPARRRRSWRWSAPGAKVVLDMTGVTYMSSAGLRMLLLAYRHDQRQGRQDRPGRAVRRAQGHHVGDRVPGVLHRAPTRWMPALAAELSVAAGGAAWIALTPTRLTSTRATSSGPGKPFPIRRHRRAGRRQLLDLLEPRHALHAGAVRARARRSRWSRSRSPTRSASATSSP